jgi:hypothetical protein
VSKFPNLALYHEHFDAVKDHITTMWMSQIVAKQLLKKYKIPEEFFRKYFAKRIIDFNFDVLTGDHPLGNCPIIGAMLIYFEKKNLALEDIFILCSNLKTCMLEYAHNNAILTVETIHEISSLMDNNLHGVIRDYVDNHLNLPAIHLSCPIADNNLINYGDFSRIGRINTTSAFHYLQEIEMDYELLDELNEIEEETLSSIELTENMNQTTYNNIVALFNDYSKVLSKLVEFNEITFSLRTLIELLTNTSPEQIGDDNISSISIYIKAILSDLSMWRKSVFYDQTAEDIHYLDKTLLSSITQLQIMLSEDDDTQTYEIEFF